jgi:hypothetical protein
MKERPGVVQRALEIAKSGKVGSLVALQAQLTREVYLNNAQFLAGRSIRNQLAWMITEGRIGK